VCVCVCCYSDSFVCPIGLDILRDPVVAADGHTYERAKIEEWIRRQQGFDFGARVRSPKTLNDLAHTMLIPNHALKKSMDEAIAALMLEDNMDVSSRDGASMPSRRYDDESPVASSSKRRRR